MSTLTYTVLPFSILHPILGNDIYEELNVEAPFTTVKEINVGDFLEFRLSLGRNCQLKTRFSLYCIGKAILGEKSKVYVQLTNP